MAYTKNFNRYNGRSNYRANYQPQPRKRSGARFGYDKHQQPYVSAWRVNAQGDLLTLIASPYKNTKTWEGKRGEFENYFVVIRNKNTYQEIKTSGLYYPDTKRLLLPQFSEIVTNNGRGGTWCSVFKRR